MLPSLASSTASVWPTAFFFRNFFRPVGVCKCVGYRGGGCEQEQ
jgi:hypothetical protein